MDATALWMPRARHAELRPDTAPDPAPHEIRVKAIASGISTGTELVLYHGLGPGDQAMTPSTCEGRWDLPVKYGYQSVGRVIDAGRSRAISGSAGRYRSIDSGPNAVSAPSSTYVPLVPEARAGTAIAGNHAASRI